MVDWSEAYLATRGNLLSSLGKKHRHENYIFEKWKDHSAKTITTSRFHFIFTEL